MEEKSDVLEILKNLKFLVSKLILDARQILET